MRAFLFGALTSVFFISGAMANDVTGVWETVEGKSHVEISACEGNKYCGKIIWLKEPNTEKGTPKLDINNQDESLRNRPIEGIQILKDLEKVSENEWDDGTIYNPEDGNTYSSEMVLMDENTLNVSGCVLFICKEQTWTRLKD
ncbi:DUF2147 domain-containing protein [Sneathiella glossodoripedis]|uniref:DUF2147 domain-containing protein n=1 Tax=Sneathiella glossodoripedis TaxID=418853 RepID=UPI00131EF523|nr:DUF2147 domain-containing protein [Sneathiella glossodoripedis]